MVDAGDDEGGVLPPHVIAYELRPDGYGKLRSPALAVIGLASKSEGQPHANGAGQNTPNHAGQPQPATPTPARPNNAVGPKVGTYQPSCDRPQNREDASFCLEREASDLAERNFWIGVLGFVALLATVFLSWRATRAAVKAAEVAERALTAASRPYLLAAAPKSGIGGKAFGYKFGRGSLNFTNHGTTPAVVTWLFVQFQFAVGDPVPADPKGIAGYCPPNEVIGPDKTCPDIPTIPFLKNPPPTPAEMQYGKWWLVGFVRYKDMLEVEYVTGFCFMLDGNGVFDIAHPHGKGDHYNYTRRLS